jgi:protoporphyrinogen oxidase
MEWAVVGGGMLGMTLARRLTQRGARVTLFESADRLGGLACSWSLGDTVWDRHYHVTLLSDTFLRRLLEELGLESDLRWVETRTGCYGKGRLYSVSNAVEFLRFPLLDPIPKLRLGATLLYGSRIRNGQKLEDTLVADWLIRWSGRQAFERFWLPLLRSKLGESYHETSAAFIWATIARLHAARRSGLKKEMFGYVPGGYARVLDRFGTLLTQQGVRVELGSRVRSVEPDASGLRVTREDDSSRRFDRVVVTVAAPLAARLCPALRRSERRRLEDVRYLGIVCASALLEQPLAGFYVTNILDDEVPFTGVIEMSALVDREQFGGQTLIYLPKYLPAESTYFSTPDEEVERSFVASLERIFPAFSADQIRAFRVSRVRQVFALPTLGYSSRVPSVGTSIPGLYLVNSAQIVNGTLNVNETVQLAERALPVLTETAS